MKGNVSKIYIEVEIDGKGGIKVLRQIGKESDKTGKTGSKAFKKMGRSAKNFNRQINLTHGLAAKLGAVFGLWKLWQVSQGFLDVATQTENYKLRLNALLGSVAEGNRMFREMSEFAGEVPFTYDQIMASATKLSGVMRGGIEEIKKWMPLIADLAAVSGLDIQTATEQIIRMYSAGAASADLFRERGITAMLGFQAGVSYSADETRRRLMAAWKDPESKFRDATKEMAKSWAGLVSMLGDKWFQFRSQVMESGPFQVMKARLGDLLLEIDRLKKNGQLDLWAADMADGVLASIDLMMTGFEGLSNAVYGFRSLFGMAAETFYKGRVEAIDKSIKYFERMIKPGFWSRFYGTNEKDRADILATIEQLRQKRAEALLSQQAGGAMAEGNIRKMDQYGRKIEEARKALAKLRSDMGARRGQRPENTADLSIPKKITAPAANQQALKDYKALLTEVEKAQQQFQDALITGGGTGALVGQQLRRGIADNLQIIEDDAKNTSDYMIQLSQRTAEAMEQNFSDFYFDVMTGQFRSLGDYATAVLRSIQRATADVMGQMTKEFLFDKGGGSGLIDTGVNWVTSLFSGGSSYPGAGTYGVTPGSVNWHAKGGSFGPNEWIGVGEKGPEIIYTGKRSGEVIPAGKGGDVSIQVNVINNGEPVEQDGSAQVRFDGAKYIADVHINRMMNNRSYRQANRQAMR